MEPQELINLQICLEYRLDSQGLLVPFDGSSEQAFYVVYQHLQGFMPFFSSELPASLREQLFNLGPQAAFTQPAKVRQLIASACLPCKGGDEIFWSGYFSQPPTLVEYPDASRNGEVWSIERDGQEVCRAISIRQNAHCAEVYVETLPAYRKRGFGRQVVAAWAIDILESKRVALYSYRANNRPSAALASSLGVVWYANVAAYEPG